MTQMPPQRPGGPTDEDMALCAIAGAIRQARLGRAHDPWEWLPCSEDDFYRARQILAEITPLLAAGNSR